MRVSCWSSRFYLRNTGLGGRQYHARVTICREKRVRRWPEIIGPPTVTRRCRSGSG